MDRKRVARITLKLGQLWYTKPELTLCGVVRYVCENVVSDELFEQRLDERLREAQFLTQTVDVESPGRKKPTKQ